jgi:integrase
MATGKRTPSTPSRGLTDAFLDGLTPPPAAPPYEVADSREPGLRVRVWPSGKKSFVWYYRTGGKTKVLTLGLHGEHAGQLTVDKARAALRKAKALHADGQRPDGTAEGAPRTVAELAELFYQKRIVPHRSRPDVVRQVLDHDILPAIGGRKLKNLATPAVSPVIDMMVERGAATHAGKALATMKQMFRFAEARGYVERSPAASLDPTDLGVIKEIRERHLDGDEIKAVWHALDKAPRLSPHFRLALKILLLTGVRSGELRLARWEHVDFDKAVWTVPKEHQKTRKTKGAKDWRVPLAPQVRALFKELHDLTGETGLVLASPTESGDEDEDNSAPTTEKKEIKPADDKAIARAVRRLFTLKIKQPNGGKIPLLDMEEWSPHDLRRTCRTWLGRLGIDFIVAEKCLNHSLSRIAETYDRSDYFEERRAALERWADHVDLLVGKVPNVVAMRSA